MSRSLEDRRHGSVSPPGLVRPRHHRLADPLDALRVGRPGHRPARVLERLVRSNPWLMEVLVAARDVDPPDWLVGGDVLRGLVWDRLHGRPPGGPRDVDLAFFDPARLDPARDAEVESALRRRLDGVPWDAKNQTAVHTWYGRVFGGEVAPLTSSADGVATWPETATAVAVRLLPDDRLQVVAPCGLDDLFGLVCRRNPRRVGVQHYQRRLRDKRVAERWPRVRVVP